MTGDAPDFAGLVARIRQRDAEAEAALYAHFGPRIGFLARRDLGSTVEADDVRSETMLRVLAAVRDGKLRTPEALPAFVWQTAKNVIRERGRQSRRFVPLAEPDTPGEPVAPETPVADPGALTAMRRALATLNPRDRAFLRMQYYEDLPRETIAARLGIAEERVRLVRTRALQRIRQAFMKATES